MSRFLKFFGLSAISLMFISVVKPSQVEASTYKKATFSIPKGYTKSNLKKAYLYSEMSSSKKKKWLKKKKNSTWLKKWRQTNIKGMKANNFDTKNFSESSKDNTTVINLSKGQVSSSQAKALAKYSLRLINQSRKKLGLKSWKYSGGTQKLAKYIADEYVSNNKNIATGHYIAGIVRACNKAGLNLPGQYNYVEDMAGCIDSPTVSMTTLKKDIYFGLKTMIFGYRASNLKNVNKLNEYREWSHAGDLFNTQGSPYDGDWDYYGFSVSYTKGTYSFHYIGVPSHLKKTEYWGSFKA